MRKHLTILCLYTKIACLLFSLMLVPTALAEDFLIDFEGFADLTPITDQYDGVTFDGFVVTDPVSFLFGDVDIDPNGAASFANTEDHLDPSNNDEPMVIVFDRDASNIDFDQSQLGGLLTVIALDEGGSVVSEINFSAGPSLNNIIFVDGTGIRTLMVSFQPSGGLCCYYIDDLRFTLEDLKVDVDVDVKPGSNPNCTNPNSGGRLPVAVLGSAELDVETIDVSTLNIGGVSPVRCRIEDVPTEIAPGIFTA